jgi:hypothetical protein
MPAITQNSLKEIAEEYGNQWQYPNCVGSLDGKHVRLKCPSNTGSQYFIYKGYFSMVLLGMCDANYRFTTISVIYRFTKPSSNSVTLASTKVKVNVFINSYNELWSAKNIRGYIAWMSASLYIVASTMHFYL